MKIYSLIIILAITCGCNIVRYDINYKGESNYKNYYIVDTISIKNPIRITSNKFCNRMFVTGDSVLKNFDNNIEFFHRPDVFLYEIDLYRIIEYNDILNSKIKLPSCDVYRETGEFKNVELYKFNVEPRFILCMMNLNYYNIKYNSCEKLWPRNINRKSQFIKVVYPICPADN